MALHDAVAAPLAAVAGFPQQMPPPPLPAGAGMTPPADSPRWADFDNAPPLGDRERFDSKLDAQSALEFSRAHRRWIGGQLDYECDPRRRAALLEWDEDAKELQRAWSLLAKSWCHIEGHEWRGRLELKELRELIGEDAYNQGRMPPCVPTWRFSEIK